MTSLYFKIHHNDDRIENFHFSVNQLDVILDLFNDLKPRTKSISIISRNIWQSDRNLNKVIKVNIHEDLNYLNDAEGDKIGVMEHYEL